MEASKVSEPDEKSILRPAVRAEATGLNNLVVVTPRIGGLGFRWPEWLGGPEPLGGFLCSAVGGVKAAQFTLGARTTMGHR
jgi:hypothetical protein